MVHKIAPTVLKLLESHDGHGDPGCMQKPQPLLMLPAPVEIQAGGKEPQADVGMVLDKHSQFLRTAGAGAPRQVAGDFKSLGPVQLQCPCFEGALCGPHVVSAGSTGRSSSGGRASGPGAGCQTDGRIFLVVVDSLCFCKPLGSSGPPNTSSWLSWVAPHQQLACLFRHFFLGSLNSRQMNSCSHQLQKLERSLQNCAS